MVPVASRLLRVWRKKSGQTQEQAAKLLPVRQATWSDYENGRRTPRTTAALDLAKITDGAVPVEQWGLFETEEDHERELALEEEGEPTSRREPKSHEGAA